MSDSPEPTEANEPTEPVAPDGQFGAALPIDVAADLQDHLMTACSDLSRLQGLLAEASETLMRSFAGASAKLGVCRDASQGPELSSAIQDVGTELGNAITALQFQDMASQLIQHTLQRLRNCSDRLANVAFPGDEDGEAVVEPPPLRPNPVAQTEMDGGSVDLF